jgi:rhodanese-related sulfurtransferase
MAKQRTTRWVLALYGAAAALTLAMAAPASLEVLRGRDRPGWSAAIPRVDARELAARLVAGQRVVFVDVREPAEFEEFRIPGALSMPLRTLYRGDLRQLDGADVVVAYCLKDFRGFEGSKTLLRRGIPNVVVIDGFGIKTWKKHKLPVAGRFNGKSDEEALRELRGG